MKTHSRYLTQLLAVAALLAIAACSDTPSSDSDEELVKTGTLTMKSWKVALIGSAGQSTGSVTFAGETRDFTMTGLGIGGVGISTSTATGVVYNMKEWDDFTGPYTSGRSGVTLGENELIKDRMLWLKNDNGVAIELATDKSGVELNLGADGSVIQWDD